MSLKRFWRKAKHVLAFVLAITLFFNGWANYDFSVFAGDKPLTVTLSATEAVYTGGDLKPEITSVKEGDADVAYTDADVIWTDGSGQAVTGAIENVGVYTATVSVTEDVVDADGNATGETSTRSGSAQFTVKPLDITRFNVNVAGSYTYTGTAIVPAVADVTVTSGNTTVDKNLYTVEATNNVNAGTANVTVKSLAGNANVTGEATGTFKIEPVVFDVVWSTESFVYDGKTVYFPKATVGGKDVEKCGEPIEITNGVSVTLTTDATVNSTEDSQKYTAQLTLSDTTGNYKLADGKESLSYTVEKRTLTIADVVLSSDSEYANGDNQVPTVTVSADGKTLVENTDYAVTKADEMKAKGEYEITVEGKGNYDGKVTKTFTISYAYEGVSDAKVTITGHTLAESVYRGSVTLTPGQGYSSISTEELGTYGDSLVYDENTTLPSDLYLKDADGKISKVEIPKISFDNVAPTLVIAEPANNDDWTNEKEITITNKTGADYGVFYTTDAKKVVPSTITSASELNGLTRLDETSLKCTAEATYYFYAVDNAGFVTSKTVTVKNIDTERPKINVKTDGTEIAKTIYTNTPIELTIVFSDKGGSKINTNEIEFVDEAGSTITLNATANANEYTYKYEPSATERKIFTINVKDNAANSATAYEFEIYYDIDAPTLENSGLVTADGTAFDANEWINADTEAIYLSFKVTDEITDVITSGVDTITVVKDGDKTTTNIAWEDGTTDYSYLIPVEEDYKGTYTVKVLDKAGNVSEITQAVKVDTHAATFDEAPEIDGTSNGLTGNDLWYNAEELTFVLLAEDATTGIAKIVATTDANVSNLNDKTENEIVGKNTAGSNEYVFTVEDTDFQLREYYFYAVDAAGNMSVCNQTVELRRDSHLPKTDTILFSFTANESENSVSNEADGKINEFISSIKNVFVRKQVTVTLYIEDEIVNNVFSGVSDLKLKYNNSLLPDTIYDLQAANGFHAYEKDNSTNEYEGIENVEGAYSIFTCEIPMQVINNGSLSGRLEILEIRDKAGNSCTKIEDANIVLADDNLIIIDDVAPELTVTYADPNGTKDSDETYFYNAETSVDLEIKETNFSATKEDGGTEKATEVSFGSTSSITSGTGNSASAVISAWDESTVLTDATAKATVTLPTAGDGSEVEYTFALTYQDPSGNLMIGNGVPVNNGTSSSKTLIVDTLAPELKSFKITDSNGAALSTDEGLDFAQNIDGDDVKITVTIDDNANYFNSDNVSLFYDTDEDGEWQPLVLKDWSGDGREWTASCTFDGVVNEEHTYRFKVVYFDRAQNAMINNGATVDAVTEEAGAFISTQKVVIDHSNPKMTQLLFDTPVQIFDEEFNEENGTASDSITNADSRMYYDANAEISFDIDDKYLKASDITINVYKRADKLVAFDENKPAVTNNIADGDAFKFTMPDEDAEYYFTISYTDRAGNLMEYSTDEDGAVNVNDKVNEAYDKGVDAGTYTSPIIIRDTVNPEFTVTYTANGSETDLAEHNYNIDSITALIEVTEMNLDMENTKITVTAKDINGNDITCDKVTNYNGSWQDVAKNTGQSAAASRVDGKLDQRSLEITFTTEANYTIQIEVIDKVGKEAESHTKKFCIDRTVPTIKVVDVDNKEYTNDVVQGALVNMEKSDITYTVVNTGKFSQIINKLTFGYFANAKIQVQIKAHDQISGVQNIVYTYTDVNGTAKTVTATPMLFSADDKSCSVITFELPISFKGQVKAYGIDNTGNSAEKTPSGAIGVIAETEKTHKETSNVDLEVLSSYSKTPDYYNGDVKIKFTAQDGYSGLYFIQYIAGNDLNQKVSYAESGVEIVTSAIFRNHTINASANNENNILLGLSLEDNAGYTREIPEEELPKIHIDTTAPKVEVEYDNNDVLNEKYYKADRIATVTVTERNFDPDDVHFELTGPRPSIGNWVHTAGSGCAGGSDPHDTHHTDSCRWSCKVHFSVDGDYTFGFRCVDLAGNEGKYDRVDEFTIDKKFPIITVVYDNNNFQNEYYYKEARTATITIEEHNFSPNDVVITMTAKDDGRIIAVPGVSGWSSEGDYHRATIHYNYDAEFTFDIEFIDLAGNQAEDYEMDHFVVDMTAPELEIFDIEHMSANNGVVRPGIRYYDTNYDKDGTVILMTGYHNGVVEMTGARKLEANGLELKLDDFAYVQEMDDLYTMEATVYDLAGNSSEAMVMFSVNRFGSVYTFDKATDALIGDNGKYYTNKEQELVITETNVDTLEFKEITMNLNGKLTTLKEGVDYTVRLEGNDATWKQYTYTLKAENFVEEGTYILTIYSEDRATNTSDNNTKGKKVEFVVDKTNPSALISGVENGGQYRANSKEMTIDVEDNIRLSQVVVTIDGVETVYDAAQINEVDGKLVLNIGSANHWQDVKVVVTDAAGNEEISEEMRVLVTANIFVQFFMNKPVFYGTLGGGAVLAALLWWFLVGKKKKKEEEQAQ